MGRPSNKHVLKYFDYLDHIQAARCRLCHRKLAALPNVSSNLARHLRYVHKINVPGVTQRHKKPSNENDLEASKRKCSYYSTINSNEDTSCEFDHNDEPTDQFANNAVEQTDNIVPSIKTENFEDEEITIPTIDSSNLNKESYVYEIHNVTADTMQPKQSVS